MKVYCCNVGLNELVEERDKGIVYPNPAVNTTTVRFKCQNERVKIELLDLNGRHIKVVFDGNLNYGVQNIPFELEGLKSGQYFVVVIKESSKESIALTKIQ